MAEYDAFTLLVIQLATNIVKVSYNEVVDLNTMPNELTVLGIHAPCTSLPFNKIRGLFYNYRKFKYLGCSVSVAPAATLPMDPAGIGYEAGLPTVDPRDVLNPILFHGTHGMSLNVAMDTALRGTGLMDPGSSSLTRFDVPDTNVEPWWGANNYYDALSDPSWKKYSPMAPFRISGLHPMVHSVVTTTNIPIPSQGFNNVVSSNDEISTSDGINRHVSYLFGIQSMTEGNELPAISQQIFTNGVEPLGWLDTYTRPPVGRKTSTGATYPPQMQFCPKAFMGILVFPPAYSVKLCFRLSIKHYFVFKDFVTADSRTGISSGVGYFNRLDESVIPAVAELEEMGLNSPSSLEISNGDVELVTSSVS